MVFNAVGDITSSGLGALLLLLKRLSVDYGRKVQGFIIYTLLLQIATAVVAVIIYTLLYPPSPRAHRVAVMLANRTIYDICCSYSTTRPTYTTLNHLVAQIVSSLTAPLRFDGALNVNITAFQTNLVPVRCPYIHFPLSSYAL